MSSAFLLVIIVSLTLVLSIGLYELFKTFSSLDVIRPPTNIQVLILLLTAISLSLAVMIRFLVGLESQTAIHMDRSIQQSSGSDTGSQPSVTTASLFDVTSSSKPTSITTTTLMYVRISGGSATIVMPSFQTRFGIKPETVPSLVSFVEEHGLELNTLSIETEDGILLTSKTPYDFFSLLSRLRPWFIPLGKPSDGTEK